jgi:hypothetical protein
VNSGLSRVHRFFRIGLLLTKELELDISLLAGDTERIANFSELVWRGPYSHVTSQSFSLVHLARLWIHPTTIDHRGLPIQSLRKHCLQPILRPRPCSP